MAAKRQYAIQVTTQVLYSNVVGETTSSVESSNLNLDVSGNEDKNMYLDDKGLPRRFACRHISAALVIGLVTNIKSSHAKGWWNESDHIRWIIDNLQKGFVADGEVSEGIMKDL